MTARKLPRSGLVVRPRWCLISTVQVRVGESHNSVAEGNCVTARWGGKQPEANARSAGGRTRFGGMSRRACNEVAKSETHRSRCRGGQSDDLGASRGWRWNDRTVRRRKWGDLGRRGDASQESEPSWYRTSLEACAMESILWHRRETRRQTENTNRLLRGVKTATEKRGEQTRAEGRGVGRWRREVRAMQQANRHLRQCRQGLNQKEKPRPTQHGPGSKHRSGPNGCWRPWTTGSKEGMVQPDG